MSVGVLLMTHESMGTALVSTAHHVFGRDLPLPVAVQEVAAADVIPDQLLHAAAVHVRGLDRGEGVLVLSDLYGATPCNIARRLPDLGVRTRGVSGLNLSMLLRVLNHPEQSLDELTQTAVSGGISGIVADKP